MDATESVGGSIFAFSFHGNPPVMLTVVCPLPTSTSKTNEFILQRESLQRTLGSKLKKNVDTKKKYHLYVDLTFCFSFYLIEIYA